MVARRFRDRRENDRGSSRREMMQRMMEIRERQQMQRRQGPGQQNQAGGPVPGLNGVHFSPDLETAAQKAAESVRLWNSPDRMNHPAVAFGRNQAGIDGLAGSEIERISGDVGRRLAESGIIKTDDGYTIGGPRQAAGSPSVLSQRVSEITPATVTRPTLGGVTTTSPGGPVTTQTIPPSSTAQPGTIVPGGLGGAASPKPAVVTPPASTGQVPGTLGTGQADATGADVIGRGTVQSETQNPATAGLSAPTTPYPAPGSPAAAPPLPSPGLGAGSTPVVTQTGKTVEGMQAAVNPPSDTTQFQYFQDPATVPGTLGTGQTDASGAGVIGTGTGGADPTNSATALPVMQGGERLGPDGKPLQTVSGGQPIPPAAAAPAPTPAPAPAPAPAPPPPPPQGTPQVPGRPSTPTVAPGSVPGQSTPSRPGQSTTARPVPAQTGAAPNLDGLGESIRSWVDQMIGQTRAQTGAPAGRGLAGLEGLGDRIRASVAGSTGDVSIPSPGGGGAGLGDMASRIMGQVRQNLPQPGGAEPHAGVSAPQAAPQAMPQGIGATQTTTLPAVPTGTDWTSQASQLGVGAPNQFQNFQSQPGGLVAPPTAASSLGAPQGTISANLGFGVGGDWSSVNQYDPLFQQAAAANPGVDPAMLKAMAVIESGGQMIPNQGGSGAYGIMQIKDADWAADIQRLGIDTSTPEGQIMLAAAILGGNTQRTAGMDPETAFLEAYYPVRDAAGNICLDCVGEDGATPRQYLESMHKLMGDINAAAPPAPAAGGPISQPGGVAPGAEGAQLGSAISQPGGVTGMDPNNPATAGGGMIAPPVSAAPGNAGAPGAVQNPGQGVISPNLTISPTGAVNNTVAVPTGAVSPSGQPIASPDDASLNWVDGIVPGAVVDYGYAEDQGIGMYGNYENWNCPTCHTGVDIPTDGPVPYTAIEGGTVVCNVGGGNTAGPAPGQPGSAIGCDAATHIDPVTGASTPGMITIRTDAGALVTYGHSSGTNVALGDVVPAGAALGTSGNNNGYHVHQEVQLPIGPNGSYVLVDPSEYYSGYYCDQGFCPSGGSTPAGGTTPAQSPGSSQTTQPATQSYAAQPAAAPAAAPLPSPSYYADSTAQQTTGQVTTDEYGRQYEVRPDGTLRLIYDPSW